MKQPPPNPDNPLSDGTEYIKQLFDLHASAQSAKQAMADAVKNGLAQQYHKTLRENPEVLLAAPIQAARRHVGTLLAAKRNLTTLRVHPDMKALRSAALDHTIRSVSAGTVKWVRDQLAGPQWNPPPATPPPEPE